MKHKLLLICATILITGCTKPSPISVITKPTSTTEEVEHTSLVSESEEEITATSVKITVPSDLKKNNLGQYMIESGNKITLSATVYSEEEEFFDQTVEWSSSQTMVATVHKNNGTVSFLTYQGANALERTVTITCSSNYEPLVYSSVTFCVYPIGKFPGVIPNDDPETNDVEIFEEAWNRPNNNGCDTLFYRNWLDGNGPGCGATLTSWDSNKVQIRLQGSEDWKVELSFTNQTTHDELVHNFVFEVYSTQKAELWKGFDQSVNWANGGWTCRNDWHGWGNWNRANGDGNAGEVDFNTWGNFDNYKKGIKDSNVKLVFSYNSTNGEIVVKGTFTSNVEGINGEMYVTYYGYVRDNYRGNMIVSLGGDGSNGNHVTLKNVQAALHYGKLGA